MARLPLPLLSTAHSRPVPKFSLFSHEEVASSRTFLPHFPGSNTNSIVNSPQRLQPEDFTKTPLEKCVEKLKQAKVRVRDSFARMNLTQQHFKLELHETSRIVTVIKTKHRVLADTYTRLLDFSARQIQRCFRGHVGRNLFRQAMLVRSVLRIQRQFRQFHSRREETRKKSRVLCRKILRGLRGVQERTELSHAELLTRLGHNVQVETQWRKAMGVKDTESAFISALYRKKYVRRRLGAVFRHFYWFYSIIEYWKSLVPSSVPVELTHEQKSEEFSVFTEDMEHISLKIESETREYTEEKRKIVIIAPRRPNANSTRFRGSNRVELRLRQQATMREIQQKKDDELRKEEEVLQRLLHKNRNGGGQSAREVQTQRIPTRQLN